MPEPGGLNGKKRRPPEGGYARGDTVREQIVQAALAVFGRLGFDGATTRAIATEAGVNTPAIQYYFSNKEGLYLACATHVADAGEQVIGPAVAAVLAEHQAHGRVAAPALKLDDLLQALSDFMLEVSNRVDDNGLFFARDQMAGGPAYGLFYARVIAPLVQACALVIGQHSGVGADHVAVKVAALAMIGETTSFFSNRAVTLEVLGWSSLDSEKAAFIQQSLAARRRAVLADLALQISDRETTP